MKKFALLFSSVIVAFLLLNACSGTGVQPTDNPPAPVATSAVPKTVSIEIKNYSFNPISATIKAGGTVTWTNLDPGPHQLFSSDGSMNSDILETGDSFNASFPTPGTYDYNCSLHPMMLGKIVVVE